MKKIKKRIMTTTVLLFSMVIVMHAMPAQASETEATKAASGSIPISSAEDFRNMENDPDGSYYLTTDITLPADMEPIFPNAVISHNLPEFTGTLDGRGHKIKGFTYKKSGSDYMLAALIGRAENATFKNLSITGVDIDMSTTVGGIGLGGFVGDAYKCTFDKVTISGKIHVKGNWTGNDNYGARYQIGGLVMQAEGCKITGCKSSLNIDVDTGLANSARVGGLAGFTSDKTLKNNSFTGKINVKARVSSHAGSGFTAAGISANAGSQSISGCSNSGEITLNVSRGQYDSTSYTIGAFGIAAGGDGGSWLSLTSCRNSGKITASAPTMNQEIRAAGLVEEAHNGSKTTIFKCRNTGKITARSKKEALAAGLAVETSIIKESFNKGAVSATGNNRQAESKAGGLAAMVYNVKNCYNTGKVTLKGSGYAGGLSARIDVNYGNTTNNYSTGSVSASGSMINRAVAAALFPVYEGVEMYMKNKCMIYNNYYTGKTKPYGALSTDPSVKTNPKVKKVSSITRANCPKLSSTYWTYSSKHKRLILKNNKEA